MKMCEHCTFKPCGYKFHNLFSLKELCRLRLVVLKGKNKKKKKKKKKQKKRKKKKKKEGILREMGLESRKVGDL
jgi:hypothetical protein